MLPANKMRQLFISDLHLQPERPDITKGLLWFLEHIAPGSDELYLLGDIFEYWIGDDAPLPGLGQVFAELKKVSARGTRLYFQHGNRDFLVGEAFAKAIGAELLPEEYLIEAADGITSLLMHGDQLCTDDVEYQAFRKMVRHPTWQQSVLSKSIEERIAMAQHLRSESQMQGSQKSDEIMDVNADAVIETLQLHDVGRLIHGHTHRPAIHQLDQGKAPAQRIVLGDWDKQGWYIEITTAGLELHSFSLDGKAY
ncbi:UDP-2,3-diacylglucosamine diphosphatase [Nitrincola sp. MINF-07-Sa-05]|uniref:UDP-2,3-diacylglucosamine diphosphatase n=1 Tax=Nitrincola salilacus TaxID=3400273 RepID=UPI003917C848